VATSAAASAPGEETRISGPADIQRALSVVRERAAGRNSTGQMLRTVARADELHELRPEPALPVAFELRELLPWSGLRRGAVVAVANSNLLLLALLGEASKAGSWIGVVGFPGLNPSAAHEAGIELSRFALVPDPRHLWVEVTGILLDGLDVVVVVPPPGGATDAQARTLAAKARQRGAVLVPVGSSWPGSDIVVEKTGARWHGLGKGFGRLRYMEADYVCRGRGSAMRPRRCTITLPIGAREAAEKMLGRAASEPSTERRLRAVPDLPAGEATVAM